MILHSTIASWNILQACWAQLLEIDA